MSQESDSASTGKHYTMGNVEAGARVMQGDGNSWSENLSVQPGGAQLVSEITGLLEQIRSDSSLDPDDRELAVEKTQAVAAALPAASESPAQLRKALRDAHSFLTSGAKWVWERLRQALTSEAGLQVLASVTDVATKAAILGTLGISV